MNSGNRASCFNCIQVLQRGFSFPDIPVELTIACFLPGRGVLLEGSSCSGSPVLGLMLEGLQGRLLLRGLAGAALGQVLLVVLVVVVVVIVVVVVMMVVVVVMGWRRRGLLLGRLLRLGLAGLLLH